MPTTTRTTMTRITPRITGRITGRTATPTGPITATATATDGHITDPIGVTVVALLAVLIGAGTNDSSRS
jgi:hypothetical protein